jgi:hypothetical protein
MIIPTPGAAAPISRARPCLDRADRRERILLGCGVAAGPVFFVIFSIAGALRPDYSALRHPVSSLEFGSDGWMQSVNFSLTGALVAVFAWGVQCSVRRLGGGWTVPVLLLAVGLGLIGAALFVPDPLSGYPPGSPPTAPEPTLHRVLHDLFSTPVFTALPAACVVMARRFAKAGLKVWAVYSALSALIMVALFVLTSVAFAQGTPLTSIGGLLQRLTLATGFAWIALVAAWSIRRWR